MTTKARGTGLGLAIVKRIIDDHQGSVELANQDEGGARVVITLLAVDEARSAGQSE